MDIYVILIVSDKSDILNKMFGTFLEYFCLLLLCEELNK